MVLSSAKIRLYGINNLYRNEMYRREFLSKNVHVTVDGHPSW